MAVRALEIKNRRFIGHTYDEVFTAYDNSVRLRARIISASLAVTRATNTKNYNECRVNSEIVYFRKMASFGARSGMEYASPPMLNGSVFVELAVVRLKPDPSGTRA
jgi:hypothetical protein